MADEARCRQVEAQFFGFSPGLVHILSRRCRRELRGQLPQRYAQRHIRLLVTLFQEGATQGLLQKASVIGLEHRHQLHAVGLKRSGDELLLVQALPLSLLLERRLALLLPLLLLPDLGFLEFFCVLLLLLLFPRLVLCHLFPLFLLLFPQLRLPLLLLFLLRLTLFPLLLGALLGALALRGLLRELAQSLSFDLLGGQLP
mmetsp:Transcript_74127/g.214397  ORF Transcript_74127/g.214397 Transcript_74127/m.214397 type:complete len:200 (-) Transcript_74127:1574-2173(-)